MTTTNTLPDGYRRDRNGFPLEPCGRCGGSGRYSWNAVHGDTCYGCSGTGWRHAVAKHHAAWRDEVRKAVRVVAQDLRHGDVVRPWGERDANGRPPAGRTVAYVDVTDEPCAWSTGDRPDLAGVSTRDLPPEVETGWYTLIWWAPDPAATECDLADDECFGPVDHERCTRHRDEERDPVRVSGMTLYHRAGVSVDPAPYVAAAERGLAYKLARRS